ncbi:hypothetical protein BpHYR1_015757, partial [Brachionus plicatilis]
QLDNSSSVIQSTFLFLIIFAVSSQIKSSEVEFYTSRFNGVYLFFKSKLTRQLYLVKLIVDLDFQYFLSFSAKYHLIIPLINQKLLDKNINHPKAREKKAVNPQKFHYYTNNFWPPNNFILMLDKCDSVVIFDPIKALKAFLLQENIKKKTVRMELNDSLNYIDEELNKTSGVHIVSIDIFAKPFKLIKIQS